MKMQSRAECLAPCKGCSERFVGCHSKCIKYQDFRQALEADKLKRNKGAEIKAYVGTTARQTKAHMAKRQKEKFR